MSDDLRTKILESNKSSFRRACQTALLTGTAHVLMRDGKLVRERPAYEYKLVPIKPPEKKLRERRKK